MIECNRVSDADLFHLMWHFGHYKARVEDIPPHLLKN